MPVFHIHSNSIRVALGKTRGIVLMGILQLISVIAAVAQTTEADGLKRHYPDYQHLKDRLNSQQNQIIRLENQKNQAVVQQQYWAGVAALSVLLLCVGATISVYLAGRQKKANEELKKQKTKITTKNQQLVQLNREVTQQNHQLEQLNRVKNQLLSIVSHDVRAPLRSIQGLVTLHKLDALSQTEINYLLDKLGGEVQHTSLLLDNILNWARTQMEGLHMQQTTFDLQNVAVKNLELYSPLAEKKQLTLQCTLSGPLLVNGDEEMINTVIRNLVNNAIKFSYPSGVITLSAHLQEGQVQFTVRDMGVGIKPKDLAKIFSDTPYTSLGTSQEKGTGLGLQVCKDFITQHKGQIWVESQPGVGTAFHFTLPLAPDATGNMPNEPALEAAVKSE